MTVTAKAIRYHWIATGAGLAGQLAIIHAAIYFNQIVLLYVLGPLLLFLAILYGLTKLQAYVVPIATIFTASHLGRAVGRPCHANACAVVAAEAISRDGKS